jgi:hypothetical protein
MIGYFVLSWSSLASPFKSKVRLEAENAVLRHQLIVLQPKRRGRVQLVNSGGGGLGLVIVVLPVLLLLGKL